MNANDAFERDAARFYAETGMLAPGKDEPSAAPGKSLEERQRAWNEWCQREAERRIGEAEAL